MQQLGLPPCRRHRGASPLGLAFRASPRRPGEASPPLVFAAIGLPSSRSDSALRQRIRPFIFQNERVVPRRFVHGRLLRPLLTSPCPFLAVASAVVPATPRQTWRSPRVSLVCPWLRPRRIY